MVGLTGLECPHAQTFLGEFGSQAPDLGLVLQNSLADIDVGGVNSRSNYGADLDFGKTILFEFGVRHAFSDDMVLDVAPADLGPAWKGGFFCPCHGSRFDLAGRVYKGVPAPTNMEVPAYRYLSDSRVLIGVNPEAA